MYLEFISKNKRRGRKNITFFFGRFCANFVKMSISCVNQKSIKMTILLSKIYNTNSKEIISIVLLRISVAQLKTRRSDDLLISISFPFFYFHH